jgi:hypothetical protein
MTVDHHVPARGLCEESLMELGKILKTSPTLEPPFHLCVRMRVRFRFSMRDGRRVYGLDRRAEIAPLSKGLEAHERKMTQTFCHFSYH